MTRGLDAVVSLTDGRRSHKHGTQREGNPPGAANVDLNHARSNYHLARARDCYRRCSRPLRAIRPRLAFPFFVTFAVGRCDSLGATARPQIRRSSVPVGSP